MTSVAQRSGVIQKNIAIMVKNLGIQSRFYISSTIGDRCVSCGQFCIVDTESQSSECFCLGILSASVSVVNPKLRR